MVGANFAIVLSGVLIFLEGKSSALCPVGSYQNICGHCIGGFLAVDELEGLDRCGVCNGNSSCVGCDGMVNSTRRRDSCGMCLPPTAEQWNDCRKIENVYPAILERAFGDQLITLTLSGAGLKHSDLTNVECHILPEEGQLDGPTVKELSIEDNDIEMQVLVSSTIGKYKIGCSEIEGLAELRIVNSKNWNTLSVSPTKCVVDTPIELELDVQGENINVGDVWCFVRNSGRDTHTIPAVWISEKRVKCSTYTPLIPGIMKVGIVATEDAAASESTGTTANFAVYGKSPTAETAEYSPDMHQIWIKFDQNIEMISNCSSVFSYDVQKWLGNGFGCSAIGDTLLIRLGSNSRILDSIDILPFNGIRRAGSTDTELSPFALPVTLPLSKHKIMTPNLSLTMPLVTCSATAKQPLVDVKVSPMGNQKLNYKWNIPPIQEARRSQRENLLMWKSARQLEKELNSKAKNPPGAKINSTVFLPNLEYVVNVKGSNSLGHEYTKSSSLKLSSTAAASVIVTSAPSSSAIVAEVHVTFCKDVSAPIRYRWLLNGEIVSEDGKILIVKDVMPGNYNVTCYVFMYNSTEVLGAGWTITEIVTLPTKVVIFPAETIIGTMDSLTLRAFPPKGVSVSWICKTRDGDRCFIAGPKVIVIEEVIPVNITELHLPNNLLPVGSYIWSLRGTESTKVKVKIIPNIPPHIYVPAVAPGIDPAKAFSVSGTVKRLHSDCRIWWSTVRQKGYNFFHLQEDVGLGDLVKILPQESVLEEREIPLIIPAPTGKWEGLTGESSYLLRLQVTCPAPIPQAYTDVPVIVNAPPQISQFQVSPLTGEAVLTKFVVSYAEGTDNLEDYPLMYQWSYVDEEKQQIDITSGVFPREVTTILPPGDIVLLLKVCDIKGACANIKSVDSVKVLKPESVPSETIADLQFKIESLMASGDSTEAFGLAITSFKTLAATQQTEELSRLSAATEAAVEARIQDLSARIDYDRKLVKISLDFLEQAVASLNYYPKTNGVVKSLTDFKNRILGAMTTKRPKRDVNNNPSSELEPSTIQSFLELNSQTLSKNDTSENRNLLFSDVHKYMTKLCSGSQAVPVVIESSIVTLGVKKIISTTDRKTYFDIFNNEVFKVNLNNRLQKKCLASAKFPRDLLNDTADGRFSDVYEFQLMKTDVDPPTFVTSTSTDPQMNLNISIVIPGNSKIELECRMWNNKIGWSNRCSLKKVKENRAICQCRDFGYVAVFQKEQQIQPPGTTATTTKSTAASTASTTTTTTVTTTPETTTPTTTSTTIKTTPTTTATPSPTTISTTVATIAISTTATNRTIDIRILKHEPIIGASFKIKEDYNKTVGQNETHFKSSLKSQIAKQLKISENMITNILLKPGSIVVTVFFVDYEQTAAETVVEDLVTKIKTGNLVLTSDDEKPLTVPPQDLKIIVPPPPSKGHGGIRMVAYAVVGGTIALIALFAVTASVVKRKRSQVPLRLPKLSIDDTPTYRQFHNEFSLDGSSASLARYRRDTPVNFETTQ